MAEEKIKFPKVIAGVFIFNKKGELFLMKSPKWNNNYICAGGKVDVGERIIDAAKREVKEETNMDIEDIELLDVIDGLGLDNSYNKPDNHLIFLDHRATAKNTDNIILNDEGTEFKWLKPSDWLKKKNIEKYTREVIEKHLLKSDNCEEKYKRALADYQNLLKQTTKEKEEFVKYSNEQILREIIPIFDNLKLAVLHFEKNKNSNNTEEGVKYVVKQFEDVLKDFNLTEIKALGEKFDPEKMEAMEERDTKNNKQDGIVAEVIKTGYNLRDKVITPAKVVVYKKI